MSIENRDLKAGTKLVARYKKEEHTCEVVKTAEGVRYRLADGQEFKSLSSAGSALMGGSACNGWRFWSLAGDEQPAKKPKAAAAPTKTPLGATKAPAASFKRMEDGRFWCDACADAFDAPAGVEPIGCPHGHEPTAAEA